MADLSHISQDGTLPDGAFVATGTGDGNVKSLQGMTETSVRQSLRAGVDDSFGFAQFSLIDFLKGLFDGVGSILSTGVAVGGAILTNVVDGVVSFIGNVAAAIGNLFGGSSDNPDPPPPPPPIFNPIMTNLEAVLGPKFEKVDRLSSQSATIGEQVERLQNDYDQTLGEQGTLTQAISNLSTEMDKKVTTSTFTQYEEGMEEQLWGENGELWRINNVLWDTQNGWNATQEKLNTAQAEINTLNNQRNDLQDQVAALNTQMLEAQGEFISRTLFAPGLQGAYDDYFSVTPSGKQWRVEAKGDWTGEYTLQSAYNTSRGWEPVIDFETTPRDDPSSPRVRLHNGAEYSTIIQYWVRQAIHRTDNKTFGHYTTPQDRWLTRNEFTFTAPIDADYSIYYRVVWDGTTYDDTYSFRVVKNGQTILQWGPMTKVGPLLPGQSGRRTRTINELNVPLAADDVLTFQTYSDAGSSSQRSVVSSTRNISWLMPYGSTWVLDTDGEGGFLRVDDLEGTVGWNWQQSVRFLISDVVAGTGLAVWDGSVYVDTPAGTVIPKGAWIRTVDPHPSSVTFRKRS